MLEPQKIPTPVLVVDRVDEKPTPNAADLAQKLAPLQVNGKSKPETAVSAAEFLLEGMYAHKRISRSEERSFTAAEKKQRNDAAANYGEKMREREIERDDFKNRTRRGFN